MAASISGGAQPSQLNQMPDDSSSDSAEVPASGVVAECTEAVIDDATSSGQKRSPPAMGEEGAAGEGTVGEGAVGDGKPKRAKKEDDGSDVQGGATMGGNKKDGRLTTRPRTATSSF